MLATTYIKGITPAVCVARCAVCMIGSCVSSGGFGHIAFAGLAEAVGAAAGTRASTDRHVQRNIRFDTGRPSKACHDERRSFGTGIYIQGTSERTAVCLPAKWSGTMCLSSKPGMRRVSQATCLCSSTAKALRVNEVVFTAV